MRARRSIAGAALAFAMAVLLAACGGDAGGAARVVDREQVEGLLVQRQRERNPRLKVESASCPDGVAARQGESFDCSVVVEGVEAPFTVTIAEVLGQQVRYDLRARVAIVDVALLVDFVRSRLEQQWRTAQIDCGEGKVSLVDVGGALDCTVSNGSTTRHIQAVVEDREGTINLQEG
ncbi:MAG: DUF4333 domain-containing protein [Acidimicrobiales bacterium]